MPGRWWIAVVLPALVAAAGCATHADRLRDVRSKFYQGEVDAAAAALDGCLERAGRKEADVLKLDRAIVDLAAGRPERSETILREVRDQLDYLEQTDLSEKILSMATDDTRLAYAGEDYEKVLVRAFLALSNLMQDGGDATAYALQISQKQQQIIEALGPKLEDNPKLTYRMVALGPYLHGALAEENPLEHDVAKRCREVVCSWQPDFRDATADLQRAVYGRHSAPGNGVLYVFTLVGRGPRKEEVAEIPTQVAMLIADRIISHNSKYNVTPTLAPIKVPKVVPSPNRVRSVLVYAADRPVGQTATITDITDMALRQHETVYPQILARAVVRRAVKKGAVYAAKDALDVNPLVSLAFDVGGVAWEATESADTRCWGLLPDKIQVLRIELPAGEQDIGLRASDGRGPIGPVSHHTVSIVDGRNTYLLAHFPDDRLVGQILSR